MHRPLILFFASHLLLACGGQTTATGEHRPPDAGQAGSAGADASVPDAADASIPDATDVTISDTSVEDVADAPDPTWDHVSTCVQSDPPMVLLPSGFCIDSTEVTRGQYQAWLDSNPTLLGQHERCKYNASFVPNEVCFEGMPDCLDDDCPQVCVDWCDAYRFCLDAGKRLCGKTSGGVIDGWYLGDTTPLTNPNVSQWYHACSSGGVFAFPYGDTFDKNACNAKGLGGGPVTWLPVGSKTGCQSSVPGYEGVYDLSGNVVEWEDNCRLITQSGPPNYEATDGRDDRCMTRGGGPGSEGEEASCASLTHGARGYTHAIGFRCCWP